MTGRRDVQRKAKLRRRVRLREWLHAAPHSWLCMGTAGNVRIAYEEHRKHRLSPWVRTRLPGDGDAL